MAKDSVDAGLRRDILDARRMMREAQKSDCNEAETRRRVERIFESLMGYDALTQLSRERAVRGAGETEHVDFAIQLEDGDEVAPVVMVEIKRIGVDLKPKHLKQVSSYAINAGCEWTILTNGRDWRLYHITYGQPPVTKLVRSWNLLSDEIADVAQCFELMSFKSVKRGKLDDLWQKTNVLLPRNMLQAMLSEPSLKVMRRELRKATGVLVPLEDIVGGLRRLFNESALEVLEDVRVSLRERKPRTKRAKKRPKAKAEAEEVVFDRSYWEGMGSPATVKMVDELLGLIRSFAPRFSPKYNKYYIGLEADGRADNFFIAKPRRKKLLVELKMNQSPDTENRMRGAGLDLIDYDEKWQRYRFRLTDEDIRRNRPFLAELLQKSFEEGGKGEGLRSN